MNPIQDTLNKYELLQRKCEGYDKRKIQSILRPEITEYLSNMRLFFSDLLFKNSNSINNLIKPHSLDLKVWNTLTSRVNQFLKLKFEAIKNTIPDKELNQMLNDCSYTLLQEIGGEYVPYKLEAENGKMFTPTFNSSDLILVPKNSTGFSVTPTTAQIKKIKYL